MLTFSLRARQNARSHKLGETFYLPGVLQKAGCSDSLQWSVIAAPAGSANVAYRREPQPSFIPDVPGDYTLCLGGPGG